MDFGDTPQEAAFRAEVRAFLDANATRIADPRAVYRGRYIADEQLEEGLRASKAWQRKRHEAGLAGITYPKEWGGRGGSVIELMIYREEEQHYDVPKDITYIGLGMCIPTMIAYASPEALRRHVEPALRGDEIWCQLFSEPGAGSDLAGLRTRAERDGDGWVINGQKVWTSGAHFADHAILVARSDPAAAKHDGLTFFHLSMRTPGIEVRRLKQISGTSNFNEVFLTDVRIPDSQRLGPVGGGWKVALTTLMNERFAVGDSPRPDFEDALALARALEIDGAPAVENPAVREKLADWYIQAKGLKYTRLRTMTALSRGEPPGPEASIGKLVSAAKLQDIAAFGVDLHGMAGGAMDGDLVPMNAWFQEALLYAPGQRIGGGTDEILRNIIAERVLGLPPEIRVDKDVPYNRTPSKRG